MELKVLVQTLFTICTDTPKVIANEKEVQKRD